LLPTANQCGRRSRTVSRTYRLKCHIHISASSTLISSQSYRGHGLGYRQRNPCPFQSRGCLLDGAIGEAFRAETLVGNRLLSQKKNYLNRPEDKIFWA